MNHILERLTSVTIRHKYRTFTWSLFRFALLVGLAYVLLQPLIYMISASLRAPEDVYDPSVIWVPRNVTLQNYVDVISVIKYFKSLFNTVIVGVVTAFLQMVACAFIGYGFARFKFKGRGILFGLVIFTFLVPPQTVFIPMFLQMRFFDFFFISRLIELFVDRPMTINLVDKLAVIYLPALFGMGIRSGIVIYAFRQFFRGLPRELEDSAALDGSGPFRTYFQIMIPNATIIMITMFLFSVVWYWNDTYFTGIFFAERITVTGSILSLQFQLRTLGTGGIGLNESAFDPYANVTRLEAGSILLILPLLIMYFFAQRYFVESVERTGIVG